MIFQKPSAGISKDSIVPVKLKIIIFFSASVVGDTDEDGFVVGTSDQDGSMDTDGPIDGDIVGA